MRGRVVSRRFDAAFRNFMSMLMHCMCTMRSTFGKAQLHAAPSARRSLRAASPLLGVMRFCRRIVEALHIVGQLEHLVLGVVERGAHADERLGELACAIAVPRQGERADLSTLVAFLKSCKIAANSIPELLLMLAVPPVT